VTKRKAPAKARKHSPRAPKVSRRPTTAKVSPAPKKRPAQRGGRFHGQSYRSSQADYAKTYGKSLPTIKRWWKEGKPLDDPDAMGEYLSPRGRKPAEDFGAPSIIPPDDEHSHDSPITLGEDFFAGLGFLAAIERLKKSERERAAAYFSTIRTKAPSHVLQNRFKEWISVIEPLRKLAKDEPEIRKSNDLTVDKSEMDAAVGVIFNGFRTAARNLPSRAAAKILGLRAHDEIVDVLEREIEVLLRSLVKLTLDEAAKAEAAAPSDE
jgi:hypothetical protein